MRRITIHKVVELIQVKDKLFYPLNTVAGTGQVINKSQLLLSLPLLYTYKAFSTSIRSIGFFKTNIKPQMKVNNNSLFYISK